MSCSTHVKAKRGRSVAGRPVVAANLLRCKAGLAPAEAADKLACEEPLEIRVRNTSIAVTMRTPGHDEELAAGFLLTEGLIHARADVRSISHCPAASMPQNTLNVLLAPEVEVDLARLTRHVFASSSCGLCGKASIEAVHQQFAPIESAFVVRSTVLARLPAEMRPAQATFHETGGLHAAAIFDAEGALVVCREDVGRHNAVDKVLGFGFLNGIAFHEHILMVSGRASFEIMQKALAGRMPVVCAVSAPSSLAVDFARDSGQTLVGFLRESGMNVYTGAERIRFA